ncbi:S-layer protein [Caulobacter segnis]|uniref:S-layer protein n=1 Tax=Caulobacter segnis TaxID=88688 RepID=A0A2W5V441_9CAUL|nr:S-layer protein [Caulobacter segnis]PZR34809.1 MAG: S-layer protein [Caulobacter segnis]
MAYTTAQLVDAYTKANLGKAPDAATTLTLDAYASQTQVGGLSDATAFANTLKLVNGTTAVAIETYQFFTNRAPSAAGLAFLVNSTTNTNDLNDAYYSKFSNENRFINFSINLATGQGEGAAAFAAAYTGVSYAQTVATAYDKIIGNATAAAAGVDVAAAVAYLSRADNITYLTNFVKASTGLTAAADIDLAVKAALIGEILNVATTSGLGAYAAGAKAMIADLSDGTLSTDNANGVNILTAYPSSLPGTSFTLTANVDTLVGTAGADTFTAATVSGANTLTGLDSIDGGNGADVLNISDAVTATNNEFALPTGLVVKNVETVNLVTTGYVDADVTGFSGLTKLVISSANTGGATNTVTVGDDVDVVVSAASGEVDVNGGKTATVTTRGDIVIDSDVLTTATVTSTNGGDADITSEMVTSVTASKVDALTINNDGEATVTTVTASDVTGTIRVIADTGTRALTVNLADYAGSQVRDDTATSLVVNVSGDAATFSVVTDAAESLVLGGSAAVTINGGLDATLTSVTVTNTAGATFNTALGTGVLFAGGAGADSIILGATTQAITTGAGDDVVEVTSALGTDGSINAGTGTDTLKLSAALAQTLSATTTFGGKIDGFEKLAIGTVGLATNTVNLSNLDSLAYITVGADTAAAVAERDTVTFGGLTAGQTVTVAGRTVTASTTLTGAQVATAFAGGTVTGAAVSGTLTDWTAGTASGANVILTSTVAGAVTNAATAGGVAGTAPAAPSVATTNGTGASDETADVTFGALTNGQSVTVGDKTYTAEGSVTAATVAAYFSGNAPTGWTAGAPSGSTVTFTSTTTNTNVANLVATSGYATTATAPTVTETTAAVVGSALVLNNLAANSTLELNGATVGTITANLKDSTGTADAITLVVNGASNIVNTGTITVAGVETVNITTTDSNKNANPAAASDLNLIATSATKVVVSGNHGIDFTGSSLAALTTLDASGVVGTGSTAAAAATAGAVTFTSSSTNLALTVTTGNGNDVINLSSVNVTNKAATISTGAGNDTVTGTASADVINLGAGNDTVYSTAGADTITLGTGNDIYVLRDSTHSVLATAQTLTDFSANTKADATASLGATATLADRTGDVIDVSDVLSGAVTGIKVQVAANAADAQTIIQNISTNDGSLTGFVLDSSTGKLYMDFDDNGTVDSVITLTGATTLTTAAFVTGLI